MSDPFPSLPPSFWFLFWVFLPPLSQGKCMLPGGEGVVSLAPLWPLRPVSAQTGSSSLHVIFSTKILTGRPSIVLSSRPIWMDYSSSLSLRLYILMLSNISPEESRGLTGLCLCPVLSLISFRSPLLPSSLTNTGLYHIFLLRHILGDHFSTVSLEPVQLLLI